MEDEQLTPLDMPATEEVTIEPCLRYTQVATQGIIKKFLIDHGNIYAEIEWKDGWLRVRLKGCDKFLDIAEVWPREVKDPLIRLENDLFKAEHEACTCKTLMEKITKHPACKYFHPGAFYNQAGDQLEVFWSNESCFGEEQKGKHGYSTMCLMRSQEVADADVVGVTVYGIKKLLEEAGYKIVPIE